MGPRRNAPAKPRLEAVRGVAVGLCVLAAAFGARQLWTRASAAASSDRLPGADALPGLSTDWPTFGNNPWQDRFAPIADLTPASAPRLHAAFDTPLPQRGADEEAYPIEVGGRLYVSTAGAGVVALDASTGAVVWTHPGSASAAGAPPNRGVAVSGGSVYVLTHANQLVALAASDGHVLWSVPVTAGAPPDPGYYESTAPIVADGLVLLGISGGDSGTRGFVEALSAADGHVVWRFFTVPPPGQGWVPATGSHGGGSVWTPVAVDPAAGLLYAAVGNPSPDFYGAGRPGGNPYTDGVVALDLHTGALAWYGPEVQHDLWDYDAAQPPLLFPLPGGGLGVGEAGKVGRWFEWDARTGAAVAPPVAFVRQDHRPPTPDGTLEWPGTWGGANYGPSAYDPLTGLAYVPGIELPQVIRGAATAHRPGQADFGTSMGDAPGYSGTGSVTAVDVATGEIRWQTPLPSPPLGGVTATAGGVVLVGTVAGQMYGLDAQTGAISWLAPVGANIGTAPIVYRSGAGVYVVVTTGGGGMSGAARIDAVQAWRLP